MLVARSPSLDARRPRIAVNEEAEGQLARAPRSMLQRTSSNAQTSEVSDDKSVRRVKMSEESSNGSSVTLRDRAGQ